MRMKMPKQRKTGTILTGKSKCGGIGFFSEFAT